MSATGYTEESPLVPTESAYAQRKMGFCSFSRSDTGWGTTTPASNNCWAGGTITKAGFSVRELRLANFSGLVPGAGGACNTSATMQLTELRNRTVGCPAGWYLREVNGVATCYQEPVDICPFNNPVVPIRGAKVDSFALDVGAGFDFLAELSFSSELRPSYAENLLNENWTFAFQKQLVLRPGTGGTTVRVLLDGMKQPRYFGADGWSWYQLREGKTRLETAGALTHWYDANNIKWTFDATGRLTNVLRPDGASYTLTYTPSVVQIADVRGRVLTVDFTTPTAVQLSRDGAPVATVLRNGAGMVLSIVRAGASLSFQYNGPRASALTAIFDEAGNKVKSYEYDTTGRMVKSFIWPNGVQLQQYAYAWGGSTFSVTWPLGGTTSYATNLFNGVRRMQTSWTYCPTCGTGQVRDYSYNSDGTLQKTTDFRGVETKYEYNSAGWTTSRTDIGNTSCPAGFPTCAQQRRTIQTDYHATWRVPVERRVRNGTGTGPLISRTTYAINTRGQTTASCQIDPANATAMAYTCGSLADAPTGVRQTLTDYCDSTDADFGTTTCPIEGFVKSVDGSRNDVVDMSTREYYAADPVTCAGAPSTCSCRKGDLKKLINAAGHVTEFIAYDGAGRLLRQKDANGVITDLVYHPRGWLISRTVRANPDGSPDAALDARTRLEYEPYGDIKRVIQPDDSGLEYCRDQAHRITAVVSTTFAQASRCNGSAPVAGSEAIVYTLDAAGNRIREEVRDSTGAIKRLLARQYNTLNQLRSLVNAPYAAQADLDAPAVKKTSYTYDANGNQDLTTDPLARVADNDYDPLNRLIRSIQDKDTAAATGEVAASVSYEYDARDNLRKVTDPKGLITEYVYDGLNNQTQLISPDTGTTTYTYDAAGNRLTQTDARGVLSQYSYDALGRLSAIQYPSDSAKNVGFTYDTVQPGCAGDETAAVGRLVRIDDATGSTRLCYDHRGNVRRKLQESGGELLVVEYRYNLANRLVGMTYPSGLMVSYGRDALGRVSSVSLSRGGFTLPLVDALSYLPFGPVAQIQFGNGQALTKAWDQNYWPDAIGGGVLDYDFSTNDVGNIVTVASTSEGTQHLNYDRLDRLQEVRDSNLALIEAYTYDATGNRLSQQLGTQAATSYSYPATSHRLSAVGAAARGYDAVGNTLTGLPGYEADSASYDARNRLVQVGSPSAQLLANYNGRGERVLASQGTPAPALPTTSAAWTTSAGVRGYLYDESGQVLSTLIAGNPLGYEEIVWIDNIPVGRVLSGTSAVLEVHAIHSDHLNTPRALANAQSQGGQAAGTVVWRWKLNSVSATGSNAFGAQPADENPDGNGTSLRFDLRFPGQQWDAAVGVSYNYFRDYEPATGRYVESDPIGLRGGNSTYGYARARVLRRTDPLGLFDLDSSCKDCKFNAEEIRKQVQLACDLRAALISDARLRKCVLKRCMKAKVVCENCEDPRELGNETYVSLGLVEFHSSNARLCVNNMNFVTTTGPVAIHEWAHSCKRSSGDYWDHNGDGVPGGGGTLDENDFVGTN